jgi:hypothetical protein
MFPFPLSICGYRGFVHPMRLGSRKSRHPSCKPASCTLPRRGMKCILLTASWKRHLHRHTATVASDWPMDLQSHRTPPPRMAIRNVGLVTRCCATVLVLDSSYKAYVFLEMRMRPGRTRCAPAFLLRALMIRWLSGVTTPMWPPSP